MRSFFLLDASLHRSAWSLAQESGFVPSNAMCAVHWISASTSAHDLPQIEEDVHSHLVARSRVQSHLLPGTFDIYNDRFVLDRDCRFRNNSCTNQRDHLQALRMLLDPAEVDAWVRLVRSRTPFLCNWAMIIT